MKFNSTEDIKIGHKGGCFLQSIIWRGRSIDQLLSENYLLIYSSMSGIPPFIFIYFFALPSLKGKSSTFKWITKIKNKLKKKKNIGFKDNFLEGLRQCFIFNNGTPFGQNKHFPKVTI